MEEYLVTYARITENRESGITLEGVYFGGIGSTFDDATSKAKECVNEIKGGTIIPKVLPLTTNHQVITALDDATEQFENMVAQMVEADKTIKRTQHRKKSK